MMIPDMTEPCPHDVGGLMWKYMDENVFKEDDELKVSCYKGEVPIYPRTL